MAGDMLQTFEGLGTRFNEFSGTSKKKGKKKGKTKARKNRKTTKGKKGGNARVKKAFKDAANACKNDRWQTKKHDGKKFGSYRTCHTYMLRKLLGKKRS